MHQKFGKLLVHFFALKKSADFSSQIEIDEMIN